MLDMLTMAKDLIKKGQLLQDPELVQMGYSMLEEPPILDEIKIEPSTQYDYVCGHCGQNISFTTDNRKKCPKCKKHKLQLIENVVKQESPKELHRASADDFSMQIRNIDSNSNRIRYNEKGEPEGMYTRSVPIGKIVNMWKDDGIEGHDAEDDRIKKLGKATPRIRQPVKMVEVTCDSCKKKFSVHPIHISGRERYLCDRCVARRSKV